MVMTRCHENESCSKVLNFLERLDDRIGCTHKETVTVIKPREGVGGNKGFGCITQPQFTKHVNCRGEAGLGGTCGTVSGDSSSRTTPASP